MNGRRELTSMCMVSNGKGNVLVQDKKCNPAWHGWIFPGGHVEWGEFVTPSVTREIREETGLTIEAAKLCGIKEFRKEKDGKQYIVFLYAANRYSGELCASDEGDVFWYPLSELKRSKELAEGFSEMLPVLAQMRSISSSICTMETRCSAERRMEFQEGYE